MSTQPFIVPQTARGQRRLLYLYGAVTQIELKGFLEVASIDSEERKQEIRAGWTSAAEAFKGIVGAEANFTDAPTVKELSREDQVKAKVFMQSAEFRAGFSQYPCTFEQVDIDSLVASQRTVNLAHIEDLKMSVQSRGQGLFELCTAGNGGTAEFRIGRTAPNAYTGSSTNPNLRFLGAYEQPFRKEFVVGELPGGTPVHTVVLVLGFGGTTANAFRVPSGRIILWNGFHRLIALRSLGIQSVPLLIQHITHPELEMPPVIADLPRDYVVESPRPALIKDFFNTSLTCEVTQMSFIKALQVSWGAAESHVPR